MRQGPKPLHFVLGYRQEPWVVSELNGVRAAGDDREAHANAWARDCLVGRAGFHSLRFASPAVDSEVRSTGLVRYHPRELPHM
jgi:hypothetical protein